MAFNVHVGDQVFLEEGGEEIGAVRRVEHDRLLIYVEAGGEFVVRGPDVRAVHDGKVVLVPDNLDPRLIEAARLAHTQETE